MANESKKSTETKIKQPTKKTADKETIKETPTPKRAVKKQIDPNVLVEVRNVTNGNVFYKSKRSGAEYYFEGYGTTDFIEFAELRTMNSGSPRFLKEPWLIVEDDEVAEFLNLKKIYDAMIDDIDGFFDQTILDMEEKLRKAPRGSRLAVAQRARQLVDEGTLDSKSKIAMLENTLNIDLS